MPRFRPWVLPDQQWRGDVPFDAVAMGLSAGGRFQTSWGSILDHIVQRPLVDTCGSYTPDTRVDLRSWIPILGTLQGMPEPTSPACSLPDVHFEKSLLEVLSSVWSIWSEWWQRTNTRRQCPLNSERRRMVKQSITVNPMSVRYKFIVRNPRKMFYPISMRGAKDIYSLEPEI